MSQSRSALHTKIRTFLLGQFKSLSIIVIGLCLLGYCAFQNMVTQLEPSTQNNFLHISLAIPGVGAQSIESELIDPLERSLSKHAGVISTHSLSQEGYALLQLEVTPGTKHNTIWLQNLQTQLDTWKYEIQSIAPHLYGPHLNLDPGGYYDTLVLVKDELPKLKSELLSINEVQSVDILGHSQKRIVIEYDDNEMEASGIHPLQLKDLIQKNHQLFPGGKLVHKGKLIDIETNAKLDHLDDLKSMSIQDPRNGEVTSLNNVVDIEIKEDESQIETIVHQNKTATLYAITRQPNSSLKSFQQQIQGVLEKYPTKTMVLTENLSPLLQLEQSAWKGLCITFIIVCLVITLVMGFKTGILIAAILPMVVFSSLFLIGFTTVSINLISMATITLVICLIVDNHIVISEARLKHSNMAISDLVRKYIGVLFTSTTTTIISFLPIYFAQHPLSEYLKEMVVILSLSLLVSLVFSLVYTPVLSMNLKPVHEEQWFDKLQLFYAKVIHKFHNLEILPAFISIALITFGVLCYLQLNESFFPKQTRGLTSLSLYSPKPLQKDELISLAQKGLDSFPNHEGLVLCGMGMPSMSKSHFFERNNPHLLTFLFKAPVGSKDLENLQHQLPEHLIISRHETLGPEVRYPLEVQLTGEQNQVFKAQEKIYAFLKEQSELKLLPLSSRYEDQFMIEAKRAAAKAGLTPADLALALRLNIKEGVPISHLQIEGESLPMIMRAQSKKKSDYSKVESAYVFPAKGQAVQMYEVSDIEERASLRSLEKSNGVRASSIYAIPTNGTLNEWEESISTFFKDLSKDFPLVTLNMRGQNFYGFEAQKALIDNLPIMLFFILSLLLWRTRSVFKTFCILLACPFALSGSLIGLKIFQLDLGFMSYVGMVALLGLVINNAILWTEEIQDDSPDAFINAALKRFRPIFLTSSSLIFGLIPLYLFGGILWKDLSIVLIFGIAMASFSICFLCPCIASFLMQMRRNLSSNTQRT